MNRNTKFTISVIGLIVIAACGARVSNEAVNRSATNQPSIANTTAAVPSSPGASPTLEPTPEPVVQINKDPKTLALAFYEFYVDGFPNVQDEKPAFANYLSAKFLRVALNADDYDPFLDAQDVDETWKGHVSAKDATTTGNKSSVDVLLNGKTFKWTMRVSLVKQGSVWKIDGIKNVSTNEK